MGSGSQSFSELSRCVGAAIAKQGCHLLTGGGGGVMAEVSRAFCEITPREGLSIGILKGRTESDSCQSAFPLLHTPAPPNPWVEIPIYTHLPLSGERGREEGSRNHINVLSSDVLVALPGGGGTYSEVILRIDYGRPVIFFIGDHTIDGKGADHFRARTQDKALVMEARTAEELEQLLSQTLQDGHK